VSQSRFFEPTGVNKGRDISGKSVVGSKDIPESNPEGIKESGGLCKPG
jgi:hypothetical protein